jgi:hypothetical protein
MARAVHTGGMMRFSSGWSAVRMLGAHTRDAPRTEEGSPAMNGPNPIRARRYVTLVAVLLMASTAIGACGGDDDDAATTTSSSPSICEDATALQSSISDLGDVDVVENGTSALESAISAVEDDAGTLIAAAREEFGSDVDDLESSLEALATSIRGVGSTGVSGIADALQGVEDSAKNLIDKIDDEKCD